ncbi:hypothetical protein [Dactylosporangium sp. NPDC049140]|uniref:hypothetical protein n=1 Tax=Dactylosporangium sp. NPDC049140 TaxID=3155647 RepID=UPI0034055B4A
MITTVISHCAGNPVSIPPASVNEVAPVGRSNRNPSPLDTALALWSVRSIVTCSELPSMTVMVDGERLILTRGTAVTTVSVCVVWLMMTPVTLVLMIVDRRVGPGRPDGDAPALGAARDPARGGIAGQITLGGPATLADLIALARFAPTGPRIRTGLPASGGLTTAANLPADASQPAAADPPDRAALTARSGRPAPAGPITPPDPTSLGRRIGLAAPIGLTVPIDLGRPIDVTGHSRAGVPPRPGLGREARLWHGQRPARGEHRHRGAARRPCPLLPTRSLLPPVRSARAASSTSRPRWGIYGKYPI